MEFGESFPSSTSVNTLISKSNSTNLTNDPSKSPILHTSIFPLSSQEYRKDFKGIRFTCEGKDDLKSNNQISNIALIGNSNTSITTTTNNNNTPTDNANQQHLTNAPCKRISFNLKDNINTKVACSNDTSPEKVMTTSIFSGIWPINPYSPLPSPDIYHLEDEFDADILKSQGLNKSRIV
ncbi:unnamed protein product [Trichobilharzia regenti]|nr:unnamed protein product [Trichobilharzia regenti]